MKILFYSTNSNYYSEGKIDFKMIPTCFEQWNNLKEKFEQHNFVVVMQKPGMFLYDHSLQNESFCNDDFVKYVFVDSENQDDLLPEIIANKIIEQKPDIAIAVTYWVQPFDWLSIKDALIAEILRDAGIKTICHSLRTTEICFDKYKTQSFLKQNNFLCANFVYVQHELFFAERNKTCVAENVYKEMVFAQIKRLNFPVVIKDTCGLSSFGMDVATTFAQAKHILLSKKNNGDRLVEEFLEGFSFGIEVYGTDGDYTVSYPLINSVNQFGLTSPKQNVKLGFVDNEKFKIEKLRTEVLRLAKLLNFSGIAQIDLLYSNQQWYIIEINSRISGMTQTMAASMGLSLYELILFSARIKSAFFNNSAFKKNIVMNLKFPLLNDLELSQLSKEESVIAVNQLQNNEAKQLREMGYCEVIFGKCKSLKSIVEQLEILNLRFFDKMEKTFYNNAKKLVKIIE